jgi:glycosyltransferase involved in cell wall biosynthesis
MVPKKIYILQSHPIQYFSPLYRAMSLGLQCNFKVFYCSDSSVKGYFDKGFGTNVKWDIPLLDGYPHQFLKNYALHPATHNKLFNLINPGIVKVILKEKPDVLWIHGWSYFTIWLAIFTCKLSRTKIWLKCESPLNQELKKNKINRFVKKVLLKYFLFKIIDKFLYIGNQNKLFYQYHGVPERKLIFSPYSVDNKNFSETYHKLNPIKNELRLKIGVPDDHIVILFSGKLIQKKCPMDLLEAFQQLKDLSTTLIFLGDGELRSELEEKIKAFNIKNVLITGFVNQTEIPNYYAISDIFVLPSTIGETWGLVVNEALNFALPVIVSDMPGSAYDLVKEGMNGYIYPVGNTQVLAQKLQELCVSPEQRNKFGMASLDIIKQYSYQTIIKEIENKLLQPS